MAATRKRTLVMEFTFLVICGCFSLLIMPQLCQNLSYSYFYKPLPQDKLLNSLLAANTQRTEKAQKYLKEHNFSHLYHHTSSINKHTLFNFIIITTKRRSNPHYLTQTTARLLQQLSLLSTASTNYIFTIYNTGGIASYSNELIELSKKVPVVHKNITQNEFRIDRYEREKQDYVSALKWCLHNKGSSLYSIVLQDDAFADELFIQKLLFLLHHSLPNNNNDWGLLKLYYPEKWQKWGNHPSFVVELILVTLTLGLVLTCISSLILPGPCTYRETTTNCISIKVTFYWRLILSCSMVLFLLLTIGRAHWEELRKYSPLLMTIVDAPGCCIPAVLYPHRHLTSLVTYLESITCSSMLPVDIAIDDWSKRESLRKLLVIPNMFNHIGMISSLPKGMKQLREFQLLFPPKM